MTVKRIALLVWNVAEVVDRIADHVHDAAQSAFAYGYGNWPAGIDRLHSSHHAVGGQHGDGADPAFAQVLLDLGDHIDRFRYVKTVGRYPQRLINRRQVTLSKLDVHHRANNLHDPTYMPVRALSIRRSHICSVNSFGIMRSLYR